MNYIKCPNCNNDTQQDSICPSCGYDNKRELLIDFLYEDNIDNTFLHEDEAEYIESNSANIKSEITINELNHIKRKYLCLKILLFIIIAVNFIFMLRYLQKKYDMSLLYVIGEADNKILAVEKDAFAELFQLIEESSDLNILDTSSKMGYCIQKEGKINSLDAYMEMNFKYDGDNILYMQSFSLGIQNIEENVEQTFQILYQSISSLFGDSQTVINETDEMFYMYKWEYKDKVIFLQLTDNPNYKYIYLYTQSLIEYYN